MAARYGYRRTIGSVAAVIVIGASSVGGWYAKSSGGTPALTANVWLDRATGNDSCTRSSSTLSFAAATGHICKHWDAAYQAASCSASDTVRVRDGTYESTPNNSGGEPTDTAGDLDSYLIRAHSAACTTGTVTFACGTSGSNEGVHFAHGISMIFGSRLTIDGGGNWRTSTPSCFRFRVMFMGFTDGTHVDNDTFTGLHLGIFQIYGGSNDTFSTDEMGPFVACSDSTGLVAQRCRNTAADDEAYWLSDSDGPSASPGEWDQDNYSCTDQSTNAHCEASSPQNLTITNDWLHDINSLDNNAFHTGQLQNQGNSGAGAAVMSNGLTLSRDRFERIVNIKFAPSTSEDNLTVENDWFGESSIPISSTTGKSGPDGRCVPTVDCQVEDGSTSSMSIDGSNAWGDGTGSNWIIRFNTFVDEWRLPSTISTGLIYGNVFDNEVGAFTCGNAAYSYNVWANGITACTGTNQATAAGEVLSSPTYSNAGSFSFHLAGAAGSTVADDLVPTNLASPARPCPALDYEGDSRPHNTNCDAGADER